MQQSLLQGRRPGAPGWLVVDGITRRGCGECGGIVFLFDLKRVEARADQKQELIAQHVARRAQLATESEIFAQLTRLAIGTAVSEIRKYQANEREPVKIGHKLRNLAAFRPQ